MKKSLRAFLISAALIAVASPAFAEAAEAAQAASTGRMSFFIAVAIATVFGMAITAVGAGFAQSNAVRAAVEGIARNPGATGKIFSTLLIGLAMIESLAIYVLVIAFILLFANPFLKFIS